MPCAQFVLDDSRIEVGPRYTISPISPWATSFISSSTTRVAMVGIGLPTEPSLRIASSPSRTQVIGDISVCPKTATLSAFGKVCAMARSTVSEAGAAPQLITRSRRSRCATVGSAHTTCHWAGTRNTEVARSLSQASSTSLASKASSGWITVNAPRTKHDAMLPKPAMWNSGEAQKAMSSGL